MNQPRIAVWLSRHPYPNALPTQLPGHTLLHVKGRWGSVQDAYFDALFAANCHPDVVFFILPFAWRQSFVKYVTEMNPATVCVQPVLLGNGTQLYKQMFVSRMDGKVYWCQWQGEGEMSR